MSDENLHDGRLGRWIDLGQEEGFLQKRVVQLVEHHLQRDPYAGDVFVFLGRDRRRIKLLTWDTSGYWLATKRLERGLYASPVVLDGPESRAVLALSPAEMAQILEGISVHRATYASHYRRSENTI